MDHSTESLIQEKKQSAPTSGTNTNFNFKDIRRRLNTDQPKLICVDSWKCNLKRWRRSYLCAPERRLRGWAMERKMTREPFRGIHREKLSLTLPLCVCWSDDGELQWASLVLIAGSWSGGEEEEEVWFIEPGRYSVVEAIPWPPRVAFSAVDVNTGGSECFSALSHFPSLFYYFKKTCFFIFFF